MANSVDTHNKDTADEPSPDHSMSLVERLKHPFKGTREEMKGREPLRIQHGSFH